MAGFRFCRFYSGLSSHRCRANIEYSAVAARQLTRIGGQRYHTINYPCCVEWAGENTCQRREWEAKAKVWNERMRKEAERC